MLYRQTLGLAILISFTLPLATTSPIGAGEAGYCLIEGAEYYTVELVTTKNIPGTGLATGRADLSVPASSPFSVAISPDGSYEYLVRLAGAHENPDRRPARGLGHNERIRQD